jgi:hypothetical protein
MPSLKSFTSVLQMEDYCCPITTQIYRHPVTAEDGFVYEKCAFEEYIEAYFNYNARSYAVSSPITGEKIDIKTLRNRRVENQVQAYLKLNPEKISEQYADYETEYQMTDLAADILDERYDSIYSYDKISLTTMFKAMERHFNVDPFHMYIDFFHSLDLEHILHLINHVTDWNTNGLDGDIFVFDFIHSIQEEHRCEAYVALEPYVDINKMFDGMSLKHCAAMCNAKLVSDLMNAGWNFNADVDVKGFYPVHEAIQAGKLDIVKLLCERIPDLNMYTRIGQLEQNVDRDTLFSNRSSETMEDPQSIYTLAVSTEKSKFRTKSSHQITEFCGEEMRRRDLMVKSD